MWTWSLQFDGSDLISWAECCGKMLPWCQPLYLATQPKVFWCVWKICAHFELDDSLLKKKKRKKSGHSSKACLQVTSVTGLCHNLAVMMGLSWGNKVIFANVTNHRLCWWNIKFWLVRSQTVHFSLVHEWRVCDHSNNLRWPLCAHLCYW